MDEGICVGYISTYSRCPIKCTKAESAAVLRSVLYASCDNNVEFIAL